MNDYDPATIIRTITVYLIPVLFAISLHEAAHGYVAKYFGDPTASDAGRLSLNPAKHIDPFGTILLPLLLFLAIHIPFGYAKPVPVDFARLRNPKKQMAWVAAAGPAANFCMGLGWMVVLELLEAAQLGERYFLEVAECRRRRQRRHVRLQPDPHPAAGRRPHRHRSVAQQAGRAIRPDRALRHLRVRRAGRVDCTWDVLNGLLMGAIGIVIQLWTVLVHPLSLLLN